MSKQDRRRYFRINDLVGLSYQPIGQHAQTLPVDDVDNVQIAAAQVLKSVDDELNAALSALWKNNPATASALGLLNKKLDIIAAEIDLDYASFKGLKAEPTQVNLSACGIAFECEDQFEAGQRLEIHLILKPVNTHLSMIGRVVACEYTEEGRDKPFLVRIDFDEIGRNAQEELIQHIVRRQSDQLGAQRQT